MRQSVTYNWCDKNKDDCDVVHRVSKYMSKGKLRRLCKNKLSPSDKKDKNGRGVWQVKEKRAAGDIGIERNFRAFDFSVCCFHGLTR